MPFCRFVDFYILGYQRNYLLTGSVKWVMGAVEKENFYILTCYDCERIATIFKDLNIYYSIFCR